jgi:hypothetical protein
VVLHGPSYLCPQAIKALRKRAGLHRAFRHARDVPDQGHRRDEPKFVIAPVRSATPSTGNHHRAGAAFVFNPIW